MYFVAVAVTIRDNQAHQPSFCAASYAERGRYCFYFVRVCVCACAHAKRKKYRPESDLTQYNMWYRDP